jgi:hypothetical protein
MDSRQIVVPLTEPVPIPDTFATGRQFTVFPDFVRVTFWSEHPLEVGGEPGICPLERQVVAKIILPVRVWRAYRLDRPMPANVG